MIVRMEIGIYREDRTCIKRANVINNIFIIFICPPLTNFFRKT